MASALDWAEVSAAYYGEEDKSFTLSNSEVKLLLSLLPQAAIHAWRNYPDQETVDYFVENLFDKLLASESMAHLHDDRYFTESEVTTELAGKAASSHTHNYADPAHVHDDRYFTESEVTTSLAGKAASSHTHPRIVGEISQWPTDTAPSGWLFCAGQAVSRATYSALFALIGTTYGSGNGSTTFNLPDLRGRVPLGQDDMGGSSANRVTAAAADSLGGNGGAETHTLSTTEMPNHNHGVYARSGTGSVWAVDTINTQNGALDNYYSSAQGGGSPHNNMPPYLTINFIIYSGV